MDLCFLLLLPQITGMIFRYRLYALRLVKVDDTAVLYWLSCLQQTLCSGQSDVPFFLFYFLLHISDTKMRGAHQRHYPLSHKPVSEIKVTV